MALTTASIFAIFDKLFKRSGINRFVYRKWLIVLYTCIKACVASVLYTYKYGTHGSTYVPVPSLAPVKLCSVIV